MSLTAIYILNLAFWNFNQKAYTRLTSEYCIEIAKDFKGCMQNTIRKSTIPDFLRQILIFKKKNIYTIVL